MEKQTLKDLRKAAFAVGVGFTLGRSIGGYISAALNGTVLGIVKSLAKNGNKFMQEVCEKSNVEWEDNPKEEACFRCE